MTYTARIRPSSPSSDLSSMPMPMPPPSTPPSFNLFPNPEADPSMASPAIPSRRCCSLVVRRVLLPMQFQDPHATFLVGMRAGSEWTYTTLSPYSTDLSASTRPASIVVVIPISFFPSSSSSFADSRMRTAWGG